jgi:SAM-dependent methyltransferase
MADTHTGSRHTAQAEFWKSPVTHVWADHHETIDRLFSGVTEAVLKTAAPHPGEHVLDIGCGGGTTVLELAARVGPDGHVVGADISQHSVAKLRERIAKAGVRNAEAVLADVSSYTFDEGRFDLAFSRLGVMFFSNPTAAFVNVRRAMKPDGRLALAVFRTPAENPFSVGPFGAARRLFPSFIPPGPEEPGMFSWADPSRVHRLLQDAGYRNISLTPLDLVVRFAAPGKPAEAAELAMMLGHVSRALAGVETERRKAVRSALILFFQHHDRPNGITLPAALWIVEGRARTGWSQNRGPNPTPNRRSSPPGTSPLATSLG